MRSKAQKILDFQIFMKFHHGQIAICRGGRNLKIDDLDVLKLMLILKLKSYFRIRKNEFVIIVHRAQSTSLLKMTDYTEISLLTSTLSAWPLRGYTALKSILLETQFLDQLHDFSLSSLNSFLHPFLKSKFIKKSLTPKTLTFSKLQSYDVGKPTLCNL